MTTDKLQVIVVGGSIGGLAAAQALIKAGCNVTVLERASSIVPAGAGLGLDRQTFHFMEDWGLREALEASSIPRPYEINCVIDHETKEKRQIYKGDMDYANTHWSTLHRVLYSTLPEGIVHYNHKVVGFKTAEAGQKVEVSVSVGARGEEAAVKEMVCDMLIGADGVGSFVRSQFVKDEKRRYAGMVAWRGIVSEVDSPEVVADVLAAYPFLKQSISYDLAQDTKGNGTHNCLYFIPGQTVPRVNWMLYLDIDEPPTQGGSTTIMAPSPETIAEMQAEVDAAYTPIFSALVKATPSPFINAIFDKEPLTQFVWGRVALLGEAAHPTTPHIGRSTTMSIADAHALGRAVAAAGRDVEGALAAYAAERVPVTTRDLLFSRYIGQLRQSRFPDQGPFFWESCTQEQADCLNTFSQREKFNWKSYIAKPSLGPHHVSE